MIKNNDSFSVLDSRINGNLEDAEKLLNEETMTKKEKQKIEKETSKIKENKNQEHMSERVNYDVDNLQKVINLSAVDDEDEERILEKTINDVFENFKEEDSCSLPKNTYTENNSPKTDSVIEKVSPASEAPVEKLQTTIIPPVVVKDASVQQNIVEQPISNQWGVIPQNTQIPDYTTINPMNTSAPTNVPNQLYPKDISIYQQEQFMRENKKKERQKERKKKARNKIINIVLNWIIRLGILAAMIWFIFAFIVGKVTISGESMQPSYYDNEVLFYDKLSINFKNPERNDVILFYKNDTYYIKRIIGLPGDTIKIDSDGNIILNGKIYEEELPYDVITDGGIASEEIKLGINEFFVLGDNRNISLDSRSSIIGIVTKNEIKGTVLFSISGGAK